jgi:hypothetical protein
MENTIKIQNEYNTLEKVEQFVKKESPYNCTIEYDSWDVRTDANGQMEKCVLIKKSGMHGMKVHFTKENEILMCHLIPSKVMNAYFGRSQKARRNILEIIAGGIKNSLLLGGQKKAFKEMEEVMLKIAEK